MAGRNSHSDHRSLVALICLLIGLTGCILCWVGFGKAQTGDVASQADYYVACALLIPLTAWIGWVWQSPQTYAVTLAVLYYIFPLLASNATAFRPDHNKTDKGHLIFAGLVLIMIGSLGCLLPLCKGLRRFRMGELTFVMTSLFWLVAGIMIAVKTKSSGAWYSRLPADATSAFLHIIIFFFAMFRRSFSISTCSMVLNIEVVCRLLPVALTGYAAHGDLVIPVAYTLFWVGSLFAAVFIIFDIGHKVKPIDRIESKTSEGWKRLN